MKAKSESQIKFSEERLLTVRRKRTGFSVDNIDWERLKKMINNFPEGTNVWLSISFASFSAALAVFLTNLSITDGNYPYRTHLLVATAFTFATGVMSGVFAWIQRRREGFAREQILNEMGIMEISPAEEVEEFLKDFPSWVAAKQPSVNQGVDYKEIPLRGNLLRSLTFKIRSTSPYWRAGFKLSVPNEDAMPKLLTPKSFLFHVGVKNNKVLLRVYHDGKSVPSVRKTLSRIASTQTITIAVERNENNHVGCYVNESLEYKLRSNPELFKKAYLMAWGDPHDYRVNFDEITYATD